MTNGTGNGTNTRPSSNEQSRITAERLALGFLETAAERDRAGGTPKRERDQIRESGLLRLTIPAELGGSGKTFAEALEVVRVVARADGSLAHVLGFHYLMLATIRLFGSQQQWRTFASGTAERGWFWGNALNPLDTRARLTGHGRERLLDGTKSFCSGSADSDMLIVSALDEREKLVVAAIPTSRAGIELKNDWDAIGQRQTDSGSVDFRGVALLTSELLEEPGPLGSVYATLRPCLAQLTLTNVILGIGEGALREAKQYVLGRGGWPGTGVARANEDPYVLATFGESFLVLESARLLCDRAAAELDRAFALGDDLGVDGRGALAVHIAAAKVAASRASLEVTSRMFDSMGARAATGRAAIDRYWRNARTLTLHDPLDWKLRALGSYALNDELPIPSFYS